LSLIFIFTVTIPTFAKELPSYSNVPLNKEWKITFNKAIDSNSLQNNIVLYRTDTLVETKIDIVPELDQNDPTLVFVKHSKLFVEGANYRLEINTGVTDLLGVKMNDQFTMNFTTSETTTLEWYNDGIKGTYIGQIKDGKPDGIGMWVGSTEGKIFGVWLNGEIKENWYK
jgi:hypothetical protein